MNGRLEHDRIIQNRIEKKLKKLPSYVYEWYYSLLASDLSYMSCDMYINKVKLFLQYLSYNMNSIDLKSIQQKDVDKYFISIRTKEDNHGVMHRTSDSHQQTTWAALNSFFKFLVDRQYIDKNFIDQISKPKNRDLARINQERKLLTNKDFSNIMKEVEKDWNDRDRNSLIIALFMNTGMRLSALVSINNEDIDLQNRTLRIMDKGDKVHEYYISDNLKDYIEEYWHFKSRDRMYRDYKTYDEDALFVEKNGKRITQKVVYHIVQKYSKKALGYAISPHKLRAGFCSILYNKTHDAEFVRRAVGHSNLATTQRYIVTEGKKHKKAANIMDKIISGNIKEETENELPFKTIEYWFQHPDELNEEDDD